MPNPFAAGEADADAVAPPPETMGARYGIGVAMRGRGEATPPIDPTYLVPPVHYINGNMETTVPAIQLTDLGAEMPHPAMPAPQVVGSGYQPYPEPNEAGPFVFGVHDAYPEGCPIPFGVGRGAM